MLLASLYQFGVLQKRKRILIPRAKHQCIWLNADVTMYYNIAILEVFDIQRFRHVPWQSASQASSVVSYDNLT